MARVLAIFALCLFMAVAYAADLRTMNAQRAGLIAPPAKVGADGKASGDLETANSWGYGGWGGGWGGPWGGPGFYGGGWGGGWGSPWGYGYGWGGWW